MAKKQKSFADKTAGTKDKDAVYVKYIKSVKSDKTGQWRFNEQMVRTKKGEPLDAALKRMDEVTNLVDIDLSEFVATEEPVEEQAPETLESASEAPVEEPAVAEVAEEASTEEVADEVVEETPESEEETTEATAEEKDTKE
jgi:hypothetical protein